jgi:hypothetical protein
MSATINPSTICATRGPERFFVGVAIGAPGRGAAGIVGAVRGRVAIDAAATARAVTADSNGA